MTRNESYELKYGKKDAKRVLASVASIGRTSAKLKAKRQRHAALMASLEVRG